MLSRRTFSCGANSNKCGDREHQRGKYHCTVDLLFDWFGISCMTTDNICFHLQNRLIQTSETRGQWYSPPLVFPGGDITRCKQHVRYFYTSFLSNTKKIVHASSTNKFIKKVCSFLKFFIHIFFGLNMVNFFMDKFGQ
jgi:hypothetical protein